jgi:hypothetical protein
VRQSIAPEDRVVSRSINLTPADWSKLGTLGAAWNMSNSEMIRYLVTTAYERGWSMRGIAMEAVPPPKESA